MAYISLQDLKQKRRHQSLISSEEDKLHLVLFGIEADLNNVISASKKHWSGYSEKKKGLTNLVALQVRNIRAVDFAPARFKFHWYCKNKRKDPDNICFTKKYILDGFVKAELMKNDGWKQVYGFEDRFFVDAQNPRVEVFIERAI